MKKFLLLLLTVLCISCNTTESKSSIVREHIYKIEKDSGCKIKNITIKEINIEVEFWRYTQEYRSQWDGSPNEYYDKEIIEFKQNHQKGTIYVAKIKKYNKFGGKVPTVFRVYTINDQGSVYEYIGLDRQSMFEAAYPGIYYKIFGYY